MGFHDVPRDRETEAGAFPDVLGGEEGVEARRRGAAQFFGKLKNGNTGKKPFSAMFRKPI